MTSRIPAVLLVDDEPAVLHALQRLCRREEFEVHITDRPLEALDWVASRTFDVVLADQRMPDMLGTRLLEEVSRLSPLTGRVLLTGYPGTSVKLQSLDKGIFHLFYKPWNDDILRRTLRRLVHESRIRRGDVEIPADPAPA